MLALKYLTNPFGRNIGSDSVKVKDNLSLHAAVAGGLSDWDVWSPCLGVGCGVGQRTRSRQCNSPTPSSNGADCVGDLEEREDCDIPCKSESLEHNSLF